MPSTLQVTPVFVLPVTVAAYCDDWPSVTLVDPLRVKVTVVGVFGCAVNVTVMLCDTDGSAALAALIVTLDDCGAAAGAA